MATTRREDVALVQAEETGEQRGPGSGSTSTLGIWFIGARGSLATTASIGVLALAAGLVDTTGCVTEHPEVDAHGLAGYDRIVTGGHDVVSTRLLTRAEQLVAGGVVPAMLLTLLHDELQDADARVRPLPDDRVDVRLGRRGAGVVG